MQCRHDGSKTALVVFCACRLKYSVTNFSKPMHMAGKKEYMQEVKIDMAYIFFLLLMQ